MSGTVPQHEGLDAVEEYVMNWEAMEAIASAVTATGVLIAAIQLWQTKKIDQTQFEDDLENHYREIIKMIPVNALLGEEPTPNETKAAHDGIYFYIDLSNEQVFLRQNGRIRQATWTLWRDGIKFNLSRAAFRKTWEEIKIADPKNFSELRRLEKSDFKDDPKDW
jgi:hypothetical protein